MNTFWIICFDVIMKSFVNLSYIKKNNMIKKIFLYMFSFLIICLWIVNFSYGGFSRQVWVYGFQPYDNTVNINVLTNWTINSELIWEVKKVFWFTDWNYFMWDYSPDLWWISMYAVNQVFWSNGYFLNQGFINDFFICNNTITWVSLDWSISSNYYTGCSKLTISNWNLQTIKNFVSSIKSTDYYWFDFETSSACTQAVICFSSDEYWKSLCFWNSIKWTTSIYNDCYPYFTRWYWSYNWWNTVYSKSYWTGWGYINAYYTSPWVNNNFNPWTWIIISDWTTKYLNADIDDYISYYEERFGWNENMCYVWTTDYETLYWSWRICNDLECPDTVNFEYWTGWTIFDLYYSLYSGFWNNIIKNVWTFINVWLINYTEQFKLNCSWTGDNIVCQSSWPDYLAKYNWPDTNISLYYEWLTPPFLNNPVAIYFMASNLYNRFSTESTQWEEMAYYCDMKLNYDSYKDWTFNFEELKDKVSPWINQRVKDYKNNQFWNGGGYSIPDFSWTNIRWNLNLTGDWIPEDLSPTQLFKQFYDRMNALLWNFNPNNSVWIIPLWILYPMLFLILFRIIKH